MRIINFIHGSGSWGEVSLENINKNGMGGRETALVNLAIEFGKAGHESIAFVPTSEPTFQEFEGGGSVRFVSSHFLPDYMNNFGADVVISWEEPVIFANEGIRNNCKLAIVEMQVADIKQEDLKKSEQYIDCYAVLSNWAGRYLQEQGVPEDKIVVLPNGVNLDRYNLSDDLTGVPNEDALEFYYSSSPDRGLHHMLRMWPEILKRHPGSTLHVAYGVENWVDTVAMQHSQQADVALEIWDNLAIEGVKYHGRIGQDELAQIQMGCDFLLYPCDTMRPTETGCITVVEACASKSVPVITDCDCLGSEFSDVAVVVPMPLSYAEYLSNLDEVIEDNGRYSSLVESGVEFAKTRSWETIAAQWLELFEVNVNN